MFPYLREEKNEFSQTSKRYLIIPIRFAKTFSLHKDPIGVGPRDLIVGYSNSSATLGKDTTGAPISGDTAAIEIVVSDGDVLVLHVAQS